MGEAAEQGRRLEQAIAAFFASNGYATRCNEVLEGRSGGRHEIDVLAEKSDALTTFRVAIECKAWQQPIEKDVVSKLHYVLGDLGLSKGIVVSLAGYRSGAERTAADLGVELWGPDELRRHLGDSVVGELGVPRSPSSTVTWGYSFRLPGEAAERSVRAVGKGWLRLRTLERLVFFSPLWLPAHCVRLTVAEPGAKRLGPRLRSTTFDNLYEALSGTWLGRASLPWEQVEIEQRLAMRPVYRDTKVHSSLRKALSGYERVSSASAVQRHAHNLQQLGVKTPCSSITIESTALVYLPYFAGVLEAHGQQRVVAVAGHTAALSDPVSRVLTANLSQLRQHFTH